MTILHKLARVEGPHLALRLIEEEDAEYSNGLRTNQTYSGYLSKVDGRAENQRRWIEEYKEREAALRELYYVIERKDGTRCGLVRLYDIGTESFTWGSWILDNNKTRKAALESAILSFGVGFEGLGLSFANVDVRAGNEHAEAFYRRLGMIETLRTAEDIYFSYARSQFLADLAGYIAILGAEDVV